MVLHQRLDHHGQVDGEGSHQEELTDDDGSSQVQIIVQTAEQSLANTKHPHPEGFEDARARPTEVMLMFLAAVGSTLGWTAVLSSLVYYTHALGANSYLILNLAVYAPLLPMALVQARWDAHFDRHFRSLRSYSFRGHVGFLLTVLPILLLPLASQSMLFSTLLTAILGTSSGIMHGTLKQLASFVYPNCSGRLPAAVTSGMQASAAFVLLVSTATGFGSSENDRSMGAFYALIALLVGICWMAFHLLMSQSRDVLESLMRRDRSLGNILLMQEAFLDGYQQINANKPTDTDELEDRLAQNPSDDLVEMELSYVELWERTWPCCAAMMITVASSMSVASWFNRVQSANPSNLTLPQVLFYTRFFADLLGRPATLLLAKPLSPLHLGYLSTARLVFVPLFFLYTSSRHQHLLPRSDALVVSGLAAFAFSSGYIVTLCYQAATNLLQQDEIQVNSAKQAGLLNIAFSIAVLLGLIGSFTLLGIGYS